MYKYDNFQKVKEALEVSRTEARLKAQTRVAELESLSPELAEIGAELRLTGRLIFKSACEGADITPIKERNEALNKRRIEIIRSLGYPDGYTEPEYSCPICADDGFVDGTKLCKCFKEKLFRLNIASSGVGKLIETQSFDNFDLEWYRFDEDVYKRMSSNLRAAKKYVASFEKKRGNLLLLGNTGTGKTHVSTAIAREIIAMGYSVIYDSAQNIMNDYETDRFKSGYGPHEPISEKYTECDLLIIDDLGTEFSNQFSTVCLYNLINTRQNKGLATIISTNLPAKELAARYDGRIYSRIAGTDYQILTFSGRDHRLYS